MADETRDEPTARERELEAKNRALAETLAAAKEQMSSLRQAVDELSAPPLQTATFVTLVPNESGPDHADVRTRQGTVRVAVEGSVDRDRLVRGATVLLTAATQVLIDVVDVDDHGDIAVVSHVLGDGRVRVTTSNDDGRVVLVADSLDATSLRAGDLVLIDAGGLAVEQLDDPGADALALAEVPDVAWEDIGGLREQVEAIRDAVELPFFHPELFDRYQLTPPRGVLLYGPPGCGKTMIAKAVANALASRIEEVTGEPARGHFFNVKGPELLNKYVGETERQIREIFTSARRHAASGHPVIVFFDEIESLFRTRGSGVSSDMESTVVPQLLTELDGLNALGRVLVIGASNREDLIDPALLRPGRLDVKIKVDRPSAAAAREIFSVYLTDELPIAETETAEHGGAKRAVEVMVDTVVERMYANSDDNRFLEVTYASGEKETLYFSDFNSGAMIRNIVDRAKKYAIKREIAGETGGLCRDDLTAAIADEFSENEDLPNTTNPDDWARISGRRGERITYVRTLLDRDKPARAVETVGTGTGQYL